MPDRFQREIDDRGFYDKEDFSKDPKGVGGFLFFYIAFIAIVAVGLFSVIKLAKSDMAAGYAPQTIFDRLYVPLAALTAVAGVLSVVFLYLKNKFFFILFGLTALSDIVFEALIKPFSYFNLLDKKNAVPEFDIVSGAWESLFMIIIFGVWVGYFIASQRMKSIFPKKQE